MGVAKITDANMGNYMPMDPNTSVDAQGNVYAAMNSPYSAGDSPGITSNSTPWAGAPSGDPYAGAAQQAQQAPANYPTPTGIGTGAPNQIGGGQSPSPQSAPVMTPDQWLAGDSTFQGQQNQYNQQLQQFLNRLGQQRSNYQTDFNTATNNFNRNRDMGMLNLGEDWTSRGMANSGLFNQARDRATQNYLDQWKGMQTANTRANDDFNQQQNDRQSETNQAIENARQSALSRMAANQAF